MNTCNVIITVIARNIIYELVTNPSPILRKPTGIGLEYFVYRYGTKCDHVRNELNINEGED